MPSAHGEKYDRKLEVHPGMPVARLFIHRRVQEPAFAKEEAFVRCLTKKLLTYAIGRQLNGGDRLTIDQMVKGMAGSVRSSGSGSFECPESSFSD